jgi:cysteine desulfurase
MLDVLGERFGNPSSAHAAGDRTREYVRRAREALAILLGADPSTLIFTSSGTEANHMVLASLLQQRQSKLRVVTTQIEHSSILKSCEYLCDLGVEVVYLPVNCTGHLSMAAIEAAITPETSLVSIQWVNNETGVIQPIEHIGALCRRCEVPFHTDAAQAVGKLTINVATLPIDFLSLTAHKFHGPQGIGALYARNPRWVMPVFHGGSQEMGLRAGTENVSGIVGLGTAARLRAERLGEIQQNLGMLRDQFEHLVLDMIPETEVNGDRSNRVCNTTNLLFRDVDGQALVAQLDQLGVRCSQSSACTNHRPEPSYVLRAMGLSEDEAYSSVRFSFSEQNSLSDIEWTAKQMRDVEGNQSCEIGPHLPTDYVVVHTRIE